MITAVVPMLLKRAERRTGAEAQNSFNGNYGMAEAMP